MAQVKKYMEGKIYINFLGEEGGGFSEVYKMDTTDYAVANASMSLIATERTRLLPYLWETVHVTNSIKDNLRDSSIPTGYASAPFLLGMEASLSADAMCNDKEVTLLFDMDTGAGKIVSKHLRAIRDVWISNGVCDLTTTSFDYSSPFVPGVTVTGDAYELAIANYFQTVGYHTRCMVPGLYQFDPLPAAKTFGYDVKPWTQILYRRVSDRQMGRGFSARKARRKTKI